MPNVFVACWTMSDAPLGGVGTAARSDTLENIALVADTQLKVTGRMAGGAFTRLLVVPEYFFNAGGGLLARDTKHEIYRRLESISARVPDLVFIAGSIAYGKGLIFKDTYNVCPVLMGGQIIAKLYKGNDDGVYQINGSFRTKTDGGKGTPIVQLPNGLRLGLDICLDYNRHRLGQYIQNHPPRPDIHVQISGTNITGTPSAEARVNGVYIHCDLGGKGANGATAWRVTAQNAVTGATVTRIQPTQTLQPGIGRLMFFTTPV